MLKSCHFKTHRTYNDAYGNKMYKVLWNDKMLPTVMQYSIKYCEMTSCTLDHNAGQFSSITELYPPNKVTSVISRVKACMVCRQTNKSIYHKGQTKTSTIRNKQKHLQWQTKASTEKKASTIRDKQKHPPLERQAKASTEKKASTIKDKQKHLQLLHKDGEKIVRFVILKLFVDTLTTDHFEGFRPEWCISTI